MIMLTVLWLVVTMLWPVFGFSLDINTTSTFPIDIRKPFNVTFRGLPNDSLSTSINQMVFLVIRNCKDLEMERHLVDLGSLNDSDTQKQQQRLQSSTIESLSTMAAAEARGSGGVAQSNMVVQLSSLAIRWRAAAYKQTMELHSVVHQLYDAQQLALGTRLYRRIIDLVVQPRVRVLQDRFYAQGRWRRQFVRLRCRAEGGLPALMPRFMDIDQVQEQEPVRPGVAAAGYGLLRKLAGENYSSSDEGHVSVATVVLNVTSSSQLDRARLRCVVGDIDTMVVVRVVHHTESVEISRPATTAVGVNQSLLLSSGDSLRCSNVGGYPNPTIVWTVVAKPPDHNAPARFLSFSSSSSPEDGNNNVITIVNQPPDWSLWQLNCSITSVVNTSIQILHQSVTFLIRENKEIDSINSDAFSMVSYLQYRLINLEKTSKSIIENQKNLIQKFMKTIEEMDRKFDKIPKCSTGLYYNKFCYAVFTKGKNFDSAERNCQKYQGHLLWIENEKEKTFVNRDLELDYNSHYFIGWKDNKWQFGNSSMKVPKPINQNRYTMGRCVGINGKHNFVTLGCRSGNRHICKIPALLF